ncbi:nucleotidyl transferase AbiEii/AbiGii toxin family protein [Sphaerochaeta halotolerans]|uniref:nucleotidyl transferase AbiEii/AbiGii toxin family protein n=1 Tax=Sphaerochaeta halotolerans TaxID=2293840 RepID=UPI00136D7511|nr:nucleotidyl transferase AbiEii/AbiGii toxin family protein [Sphaerochaeta halotolerans]MXI87040.1 nucleotidyl transferase AbiEii/AbiGii toxin family protein [Sphaerochaeta halotolerans]
MSIRMIEQRLASYSISSEIEEMQALREITQEVVLASLGRAGFFQEAIFQGGTCLRIFHGLNRFSEDLDFSLMNPNPDFAWHSYLKKVIADVSSFGYDMEVSDRHSIESEARLAFLKDDAVGKVLQLHYIGKTSIPKKIRIKLEIDTNPPPGSRHELTYIGFPYLSPVTIQDPSSLFAGKIHALLCRNYIKGRDWYDFLWYTARKTPVNYHYLGQALHQKGPWEGMDILIDQDWLRDALSQKINQIDWQEAANDVRRFIPVFEQPSLDLWSKKVFLQQLNTL